MKRFKLLMFLLAINFFSYSYTMETFKKDHVTLITTSKKHLLTSKTKLIHLPNEDAAHALHFGMDNEKKIQHLKSIRDHNYQCLPCKPSVFKKKDILRLQELLHKPSLLNKLAEKEYYKDLSLAEQFKVPFLYAALLNAQLPLDVLTLITQKYLCLHDLPNAMREKLCNNEITDLYNDYKNTLSNDSLKEEIRNNYTDWLTAINDDLDNIFKTITLPQALFLSLLCNQRKNSSITITLRPSTLGFKECASLLKDNETFMDTIYEHKLITLKYELSQQNNDRLVALHFKV